MVPKRPLQVIILHNLIFGTTSLRGKEVEVNACAFHNLSSANQSALF